MRATMARLTTHVLDTAHGVPGAGIAIALYRIDRGMRVALKRAVTNADGRVDSPLLEGSTMAVGSYELDFAVGDYFAGRGVELPTPRFLDVVTLRFGIADPAAHYHV